jgi:hypothetical protein
MTASPPSPDTKPHSPRALLALVGGALIAFLLTLLNRYLGLFVPLPTGRTPLTHLISLAYLFPLLFAFLTAATGAARLPQSPGFLGLVGLLLAVPMGLVYLLTEIFHVGVPLPLFLTANNLFLPVGVMLLGAALGRKIIRHPNTLLALAGIVIFFDVVMVTMGTVAQAMQSGSKLISLVSAAQPALYQVGAADLGRDDRAGGYLTSRALLCRDRAVSPAARRLEDSAQTHFSLDPWAAGPGAGDCRDNGPADSRLGADGNRVADRQLALRRLHQAREA